MHEAAKQSNAACKSRCNRVFGGLGQNVAKVLDTPTHRSLLLKGLDQVRSFPWTISSLSFFKSHPFETTHWGSFGLGIVQQWLCCCWSNCLQCALLLGLKDSQVVWLLILFWHYFTILVHLLIEPVLCKGEDVWMCCNSGSPFKSGQQMALLFSNTGGLFGAKNFSRKNLLVSMNTFCSKYIDINRKKINL